MTKNTILYRPVGSEELVLIEEADFTAFPPRLPEQPIFYPVTNEEYAIQIARDWNVKHNDDHKGYVTRFKVSAAYLNKFDKKVVGGAVHEEYWIPAENLNEFNEMIEGKTEVIHTFTANRDH